MVKVEIRCPVGPQRLFMKLVSEGERPKVVDGNLIELACADCRRTMRQEGRQVRMVYHYYNLAGEHVVTKVERPGAFGRWEVDDAE